MGGKNKKEEVIEDSEDDEDFADEEDEVIPSLLRLRWKRKLRRRSRSFPL